MKNLVLFFILCSMLLFQGCGSSSTTIIIIEEERVYEVIINEIIFETEDTSNFGEDLYVTIENEYSSDSTLNNSAPLILTDDIHEYSPITISLEDDDGVIFSFSETWEFDDDEIAHTENGYTIIFSYEVIQ